MDLNFKEPTSEDIKNTVQTKLSVTLSADEVEQILKGKKVNITLPETQTNIRKKSIEALHEEHIYALNASGATTRFCLISWQQGPSENCCFGVFHEGGTSYLKIGCW